MAIDLGYYVVVYIYISIFPDLFAATRLWATTGLGLIRPES